jgi:hypothetical protein
MYGGADFVGYRNSMIMLVPRIVAVATFLLIGPTPIMSAAADHAHHSPAKMVISALSGATVEGEDENGKTYVIHYQANGNARRTLNDVTETGIWTVDPGGHYCETWTRAYGGKKRCAGIEVTGPLLIIRGKIKTTRTVVTAPVKRN